MKSMLTRIEPEKDMDPVEVVLCRHPAHVTGALGVICTWGTGERTRYMRMRSLPAESLKVAEEIAEAIVARVMRRGYFIKGNSKEEASTIYYL